jgi:hypothetical protein
MIQNDEPVALYGVALYLLGIRVRFTDRMRVRADDVTCWQAVGLSVGPHGHRPTDTFAQPDYGLNLESGARSSPDSSGSPQQYDAIAFCTVV